MQTNQFTSKILNKIHILFLEEKLFNLVNKVCNFVKISLSNFRNHDSKIIFKKIIRIYNCLPFWKILVDQGLIEAQYRLGDMYFHGFGIKKTIKKRLNTIN